ncbi:hypothetical protein [Pseudobacteriovorax antillogorgiicola]|uniref:Lipoprotein n=1 Tax=Pseudobacteriovorax antillogorgiicola TaxID=1513793 RepID=A0A1Y6CEF4_9BACT|nr:hypothetical protein [Pseudobacteriovorax antillogorgiicola]TCS47633.1 hypothetical protein EDD56_12074 [Pseudobacteriovorax antillogorgiicola]SMF59956.1 hypothetical protein SAMN06296036_12066 [Pseudobacteriovorax antillogorgiicola]
MIRATCFLTFSLLALSCGSNDDDSDTVSTGNSQDLQACIGLPEPAVLRIPAAECPTDYNYVGTSPSGPLGKNLTVCLYKNAPDECLEI